MCRFLVTLLVAAVIVAGAAYYLGWIDFATHTGGPNDKRITVSMEVDRERIQEDTEIARTKAREIGKSIQEQIGARSDALKVQGSIVRMDEENRELSLTTPDNRDLILHIDPSAKIHRNDATIAFRELRVGDQVTVVYVIKDGKKHVHTIEVVRS